MQKMSKSVKKFFLTNGKKWCNIFIEDEIMILKILIFISIFFIVKKIIIKILALEIIEKISEKKFLIL